MWISVANGSSLLNAAHILKIAVYSAGRGDGTHTVKAQMITKETQILFVGSYEDCRLKCLSIAKSIVLESALINVPGV